MAWGESPAYLDSNESAGALLGYPATPADADVRVGRRAATLKADSGEGASAKCELPHTAISIRLLLSAKRVWVTQSRTSRDPRWCSSPESSDREDAHPSRRCHRAPARTADPGGDGHRRLGAGRGRSRADPLRLARPARLESPCDDERARIDHTARRADRRAGRHCAHRRLRARSGPAASRRAGRDDRETRQSDADPYGSGSHAIRTRNRCNGPSGATSAAPTQVRVRRGRLRSYRRMRRVQQEEDGGTANETPRQRTGRCLRAGGGSRGQSGVGKASAPRRRRATTHPALLGALERADGCGAGERRPRAFRAPANRWNRRSGRTWSATSGMTFHGCGCIAAPPPSNLRATSAPMPTR